MSIMLIVCIFKCPCCNLTGCKKYFLHRSLDCTESILPQLIAYFMGPVVELVVGPVLGPAVGPLIVLPSYITFSCHVVTDEYTN